MKALHDKQINFRMNRDIVDAASAQARAVGMSLTEVLRDSLRAAAQGKLNHNGEPN